MEKNKFDWEKHWEKMLRNSIYPLYPEIHIIDYPTFPPSKITEEGQKTLKKLDEMLKKWESDQYEEKKKDTNGHT